MTFTPDKQTRLCTNDTSDIIFSYSGLLRDSRNVRKRTNIRTCEPNDDSNQPALPRSLIRVVVFHMTKLCILSYLETRPVKILIRLHESDLNLRWVNLSEDIVFFFFFCLFFFFTLWTKR